MKKQTLLSVVLFIGIVLFGCKSSKTVFDKTIEIQFIRNATVIVSYGDIKILVDPILADKGIDPPMPFSNQNKNPTIHLPVNKNEIIKDVNAVLITHYHPDHFDMEAERIVPKNTLIFCQPGDDIKLKEKGFLNVMVINDTLDWKGIKISRFLSRHHKGAKGEQPFGESSSYFLQTKKEGIFFTGDAILDDRLRNSLTKTQPKTIIANTGECQFTVENPVLDVGTTMTLTTNELKEISQFLPKSKIIAIHMDAINHCGLTKSDLLQYIDDNNLEKNIVVPKEGDKLTF